MYYTAFKAAKQGQKYLAGKNIPGGGSIMLKRASAGFLLSPTIQKAPRGN